MTQANRGVLSRLAAEFSGCVRSCSLKQRALPPHCIRTDLDENSKETVFREKTVPCFKNALAYDVPAF